MSVKNEVQKTCQTCRYFQQHYVKWVGKSYRAVNCGHCTTPRCRDKKTDTPACQRYSERY